MPHLDNDDPRCARRVLRSGGFLCRGSEAQPVLDRWAALRCRQAANPPSKKEYFLIATTPQALARGVTAQLVQKPRRVSPPQRRKKVKSFSQATCAAEKIPLGLQTCALQQAADSACDAVRPQTLSSKKYYFFDKENPAGDCLRGCLRVAAVYCIRGGPCPLGLPCGSVT